MMGCTHVMYARSRMTIDPRIPTRPGMSKKLNKLGFWKCWKAGKSRKFGKLENWKLEQKTW